MKARLLYLSASMFLLAVVFTACQKDAVTATDYTTETTTHSDDQSRFSNEIDGVANDADAAVEASSGFTGRIESIQSICDATIVVDSYEEEVSSSDQASTTVGTPDQVIDEIVIPSFEVDPVVSVDHITDVIVTPYVEEITTQTDTQ